MAKKVVTVSMEEEQVEKLRKAAYEHRTSKSGFLRKLFERFLREQEDEKTR